MYPDNLFESVAENILAKVEKRPATATIQKEASAFMQKVAFDPHMQAHMLHVQMAQQAHDDAVRMHQHATDQAMFAHQQAAEQSLFGRPIIEDSRAEVDQTLTKLRSQSAKADRLMLGVGGLVGLGVLGAGSLAGYNAYQKWKERKNMQKEASNMALREYVYPEHVLDEEPGYGYMSYSSVPSKSPGYIAGGLLGGGIVGALGAPLAVGTLRPRERSGLKTIGIMGGGGLIGSGLGAATGWLLGARQDAAARKHSKEQVIPLYTPEQLQKFPSEIGIPPEMAYYARKWKDYSDQEIDAELFDKQAQSQQDEQRGINWGQAALIGGGIAAAGLGGRYLYQKMKSPTTLVSSPTSTPTSGPALTPLQAESRAKQEELRARREALVQKKQTVQKPSEQPPTPLQTESRAKQEELRARREALSQKNNTQNPNTQKPNQSPLETAEQADESAAYEAWLRSKAQ